MSNSTDDFFLDIVFNRTVGGDEGSLEALQWDKAKLLEVRTYFENYYLNPGFFANVCMHNPKYFEKGLQVASNYMIHT